MLDISSAYRYNDVEGGAILYIKNVMDRNKLSQYRLSEIADIPKATLSDIINGKTKIEKCSAITLYKLSKALDVSMNDIMEKCLYEEKMQEELIASYEYGLPNYLQHDLDMYKEGLKNKSSLIDCFWNELYSSINIAEISERVITKQHANYLRNKFLGI